MRNFIQPGHVLTMVAPSGGVTSGQPVLIGSIFGVCATDADAGAQVEVQVEGVFDLPRRVADAAWLAGAPVYFDATNGVATTASAEGDALIGVAVEGAASNATIGRVRLIGQALAA
jgi:predicted RecA/RadA family phage recombinase